MTDKLQMDLGEEGGCAWGIDGFFWSSNGIARSDCRVSQFAEIERGGIMHEEAGAVETAQ